jgi:PhnB protein
VVKKKRVAAKSKSRAKAKAKVASRRPNAKRKVARVNPVPKGQRSITVNLVIPDAARAIDWYVKALGAKELARMMSPDGTAVWHASLRIGDSILMVNDPVSMTAGRQFIAHLWVYGADVKQRWQRALDHGAEVLMPLWDTFWGDRCGTFVDPFGQQWSLAERIADLTPKQIKERGEAFARAMAAERQP